MKKFYKLVSVHQEGSEGWSVKLDAKPIKTPLKTTMIAPSRMIADAIAAEWRRQGEHIDPKTMPLTQILSTAVDIVPHKRADIVEALARMIENDLLLYRAAAPAPLVDIQEALWTPWLKWFHEEFGIALKTTSDLQVVAQNPAAAQAVRNVLRAMDDHFLNVTQLTASLSGSIVLALAFSSGQAGVDDVMSAAFAEEDHNGAVAREDVHGRDPHLEKIRAAMEADLEAAALFIAE